MFRLKRKNRKSRQSNTKISYQMVNLDSRHLLERFFVLRILTPPMETPDPPTDTPGASKQDTP